ncbi:MAG TPA: hypothetical protein VF682_16785 [Pseudomonas sp.]
MQTSLLANPGLAYLMRRRRSKRGPLPSIIKLIQRMANDEIFTMAR